MEFLLYVPARLLVGLAQLLPLGLVARIGRGVGWLVYLLDARHRKVAVRNMTEAFRDERGPEEIRSLARENFRRIGESFACAIKTMGMKAEAIPGILEMGGTDQFRAERDAETPQSRVFAVGHFGNFELYARCHDLPVNAQYAPTYRGLRQKSLDRLLADLRDQTGCLYFERRRDARELKAAMSKGGIYLGLLADQHAGDNGLRLPFFGRECSVSAAPAVFALRYDCPLHVVMCHRIALARWRIVFHDPIPTCVDGEPRSSEDIMRDVNEQFEEAIRQDPANWFWVHNRWKPRKKKKVKEDVR